MQRGADKLRARCFMKQHASRDARVPGSLAAQPRPASVAPSAGRDRAARVDPWPSGPDATRALGRTPPRAECRALGCATYMGAPLTGRRFLAKSPMDFTICYMWWRSARGISSLEGSSTRLRLSAMLALLARPASHCFALSPPVLHRVGPRGDGLPGRAHGSAHPRLVGPLVGG